VKTWYFHVCKSLASTFWNGWQKGRLSHMRLVSHGRIKREIDSRKQVRMYQTKIFDSKAVERTQVYLVENDVYFGFEKQCDVLVATPLLHIFLCVESTTSWRQRVESQLDNRKSITVPITNLAHFSHVWSENWFTKNFDLLVFL